MIGLLRVLYIWKAAENARHCRLREVARDVIVTIMFSSFCVLNRAGEAVDLGPDKQRREELGRVEATGFRLPFLQQKPLQQPTFLPIDLAHQLPDRAQLHVKRVQVLVRNARRPLLLKAMKGAGVGRDGAQAEP